MMARTIGSTQPLPIAIVGAGAVTAVGFNAAATFAAIRAGVSGVRDENLWDPTGATWLRAARPRTPQWWEGADMLAELAAAAVSQCLDALPAGVRHANVPILLLLEPERPMVEEDHAQVVWTEMQRRLGHAACSGSAVYSGKASIVAALQAAAALMKHAGASHVVVAGVDSYLRQDVVDTYIAANRILTQANSNGFIPGEAACAVLVAAPGAAGHVDALHILGWGVGQERGTIDGDTPLSGDGLTQALRDALYRAELTWAQTDYWLTDQNAEHYKAKECTIAQIRLERRQQPAVRPYQLWRPIKSIGEIGCAIAPALLGIAWAAGQGGYAPGPVALMSVGDDGGARAAFVLQWAAGA